MKRIILITALWGFIYGRTKAQTVINIDTANKSQLTIEGNIDAYYGYDFNKLQTKDRPYFVSHSRNNEVNLNLAYISFKYSSERFRATVAPGFGTYMNANYAAESGSLKYIVEAYAGFKPFAKKNIWLDIGILPSPYTNESAFSFNQLVYTRTYGAENSPYYLAGARLSLPLSKKLTTSLYLLNGWQQISDVNNSMSFGSNLELSANEHLTLDWDTYIGDESSAAHPDYRTRYFTDLYATWNPSQKISFAACTYIGLQKKLIDDNTMENSYWWHANTAIKYSFSKHHSLSARVEYFDDKDGVIVQPITNVIGFNSFSESLCYNWSVTDKVLFRVEARYFQSGKEVYLKETTPVKNDLWMIAGVTTRF
ncbi:outer membrane beta-barrel protein [Pinibacter soli]|uniref:Outer membrane beta-barrel protein n=1 Tax=Pinibacter soli TaxID=3044211 RepID=A0ABT6RDG0_9BACT|nr:outer membrane beta-barrel protein [Pinibacter soli]MDI3320430.1 outer membrane beta-barrel protein [Pinibacter soli]